MDPSEPTNLYRCNSPGSNESIDFGPTNVEALRHLFDGKKHRVAGPGHGRRASHPPDKDDGRQRRDEKPALGAQVIQLDFTQSIRLEGNGLVLVNISRRVKHVQILTPHNQRWSSDSQLKVSPDFG